MQTEFNDLSVEQKYDLLKRVVEKVCAADGNDDSYAFQEQEGYVNLIGARGFKDGKSCESQSLSYDDTLFVVFKKDGQKKVEAFVHSTEYGSNGTAYLALGQHKYRLHYHKEGLTAHLHLSTAPSYQPDHKYRALEPDPAVRILRDSDRDGVQDEGEVYEDNNDSINIHYGGESTPSAWSEGCQVLKGWSNYKLFIELVESDHSIKGTINNELASTPAQNGTRSVIYTLVTGTFIEETLEAGAFVFPVKLNGGNAVTAETVETFFKHTEKDHKGGYFPLGANTVWHGGLHIRVPERSDVFAIADGEVVAVKLADSSDKADGHYGSHNFILTRHEVKGKSLNRQFEQGTSGEQESHVLQSGESLEQLAQTWETTVQQIRNANSALEGHFGQNAAGTKSWYWAGDNVLRPAGVPSSQGDANPGGDAAAPVRFDDSDTKYFYCLYMHLAKEPLDAEANAKLKDFKWLPMRIETTTTQSSDTHVVAAGEKLEDLAANWGTTVAAIRAANPSLSFGQNSSGTVSWFHPGDTVNRPPITIEKCIIDQGVATALKAGDVVKLSDVRVRKGELLWTSGSYGTDPAALIHWEIFSEENLFPTFTAVEDSSNDYNMDSRVIFDMVEQDQGWFNDNTNLDADEVINFYEKSDKAAALREYSCKFVSEWAMDLDAAIPKMKGRYITYGLKERLEPYVWWPKARAKGVILPSSTQVWHYNPVMFVHKLNGDEGSAVASQAPTTDATTFSQNGRQLLQQVEELRLQPYDDQTGETITAWVQGATIGYGHLIPQNEWDLYSEGITQEQADQLFTDDLEPFVNAVNTHINVQLNQHEFDALVIFVYNIGISAFASSSAVALINDPNAQTDYDSLEDAWKAWNKSQGQVMQGLINRRNAEWRIYSEGVYESW